MKHSVPIQLRFNDSDALGHINNSTYLSFYDLGKTEYFRTIFGNNYFSREVDIVVAHVEVDFIAPIFLTDNIAVQTTVPHIGNKSMQLQQQIVDTVTGEIKCTCKTIMVGYDFRNKVTIPISDKWRSAINTYENGDTL